MKKYALIFLVSNLAISICLGIILTMLDISGGSTAIATVIAASAIAAWRFIKDHDREPTDDEKSSYSKLSLLYITIASAVFVALYIFIAMPDDMVKTITSVTFMAIMFICLAIFALIYYFAIKLSFSWYIKMHFKKHAQT